jgi:putative hydrolase of the HAD superfamily
MADKAVIFDLYGTLVANFSLQEHEAVLKEMATIVRVPPDDYVRMWFDSYDWRAIGKISSPEDNIEYICRKLCKSVDKNQIKEAGRIRREFTRRGLKPWPDAVPVLSLLREMGYKTALISDCSAETPESWKATPLATLFDVTVFSCVVGFKKPDPRIYLRAAEQLNAKPEDCLYIGDGSSQELKGAELVGMHPVMIRSPLESPDAHRIDEGEWTGPRISSLWSLMARQNMVKTRVQAIVIQNNCVLFGYGKGHHFFIGGGLEEGETPEQAVVRELEEEVNIKGTVAFRIKEPPVIHTIGTGSYYDAHVTFLVDIHDQVPRLGYDPEETHVALHDKGLAGIDLVPLDRHESFTEIDIRFFRLLMTECVERGLGFTWTGPMQNLIKKKEKK